MNTERGIKRFLSESIKNIKEVSKELKKHPENEELKTKLNKYMFEKLLIQLLFDGPDLTYSPSRFATDESFEEILKSNLLISAPDKFTMNNTLVLIYKSLNLTEE